MKNWFRFLFLPFSVLYGCVAWLRLKLFEFGFFKRSKFDIPTIGVGNLSMGGAGKTPHVEFLLRHLSPYIKMGVLSRGYKRKTVGYLRGLPEMTAEELGDEPLQYLRKFPQASVAVGERRVYAIPQMLREVPDLQTIVLDDAYQHLPVEPGLQILLTEYDFPFWKDFVVPTGRLREFRSGYKRAQAIVVTKCPPLITMAERSAIIAACAPKPHQKVFFSSYQYQQPYRFGAPEEKMELHQALEVFLICGIANEQYLLQYLKGKLARLDLMAFADHHPYDTYDLGRIAGVFAERGLHANRILLTTEKDAMRLEMHADFIAQQSLPLYVLPIEVEFLFEGDASFLNYIKQWLLDFKI